MKQTGLLLLVALLPLGVPDDVLTARNAACPAPAFGNPYGHALNIHSDEIWRGGRRRHLVSEDIMITATVTIQTCSEVLIAAGKTITVGEGGKLLVQGTAEFPINIRAEGAEPFTRIVAMDGGTLHFSYTTITGGGDPANLVSDVTGTIFAIGAEQYEATQPIVFVDHVRIIDSKSNGLYLGEGAGFAPGSNALTVSGADEYPISIWPRAVGTVPVGQYTGNSHDAILLPGVGGAGAVQENTTMYNRGVPYQVGNSITEGFFLVERQEPNSPGVATLTIEPGVHIRMKKGGSFQIQRGSEDKAAQGALIAVARPSNPIVFTSSEPQRAAGDWYGVWFGNIPSPSNKMSFVRVEFAGGKSGAGSDACNPIENDAAIRIFGPPSSAFVTNTTIANSAGHGIDRGWRSDSKPSFLPTNTLTGIAKCQESWPRDTNGECPADFKAPLECWPQQNP